MYSDKKFKSHLDPYYSAVIRNFGEEYLDRSGFFIDDNREDASIVEQFGFSNNSVSLTYGNWEKVCSRLPIAPLHKRVAVLVSTGCFNPVHDGHIHMMEAAKKAVEAKGWYVAGGFLSPSHDNYASVKPNHLPAADRIALASIATESSDWLTVDAWESMGVPYSINFTDVIRQFQLIANHISNNKEVEVFYVFGSDNAAFLYSFVEKGRAVCVSRTSDANFRVQRIMDEIIKKNGCMTSDRLLSSFDVLESSSTNVWNGDYHCVNEDVLESFQIMNNTKIVRHITMQYELFPIHTLENPDVVMLRDDSVESCGHFNFVNVDEAVCKIARALETYSNDPVSVDIKTSEHQREYLSNMVATLPPDVKCINLDPWTVIPGVYTMNYSRLFSCGDIQTSATTHVVRPGYNCETARIADIPDGKYLLVDDDIATGKTIEFAKFVLGPNKQVVQVESLTKTKYHDYVDVRDFIIGALHGGLVVRRFGHKMRAPYIWPFVNASTRANIAIKSCKVFSKEILRINIELYSGTLLTLNDIDPATKRFIVSLGFANDARMEYVCKTWLDILNRSNII